MNFESASDTKIDQTARDAWLVTFADLLALMLTFFVLLFSMSQVRLDAWESLVEAMTDRMSPRDEWREVRLVRENQVERVDRVGAVELGYLEAVLAERLRADVLLSDAVMQRLDDRLVLSLPGDLMFEPSRAPPTRDVISSDGHVARLRAVGLGAARFYELSPKLDERRRLRLGARVDLVVLKEAPMELDGDG